MITYVVEGSEDGLLLGTTSKKAAIKRACEYVGDDNLDNKTILSTEISHQLKELNTFTVSVDTGNLHASITVFDSKN